MVAMHSLGQPFALSADREADDDKLITIREARRLLPGRNGRTISLGAIYRWSLHGCRGVTLATWQSGSLRCTTRRAVREFIAALTASRDGQPVEARMPPTAARRRAEVARRLDAIGI